MSETTESREHLFKQGPTLSSLQGWTLSDSQKATFGGGCFWCTEAIFKRLRGVKSVVSGYAGGKMENPNYEAVSSGSTGHAEVIQIEFDPKVISFEKLLEIFFATHDPTSLNKQGADAGTQYRSVIFYENSKQKKMAERAKELVNKLGRYKNPVDTEIVPLGRFYKAEDYHQNYYDKNRMAQYCQIVIDPKIKKLLEEFKEEVKKKV